jgi:hypothetical protein
MDSFALHLAGVVAGAQCIRFRCPHVQVEAQITPLLSSRPTSHSMAGIRGLNRSGLLSRTMPNYCLAGISVLLSRKALSFDPADSAAGAMTLNQASTAKRFVSNHLEARTAKSASFFFPPFKAATSHRGLLPLPAQV